MTTQELKQQIDKVLGNSIRCLLPSYWWKRLFSAVIDNTISKDEVKTINGEPILGEGDLRVGVKSVESVEALEKLDARVGEIASALGRTEPATVKFADCYVSVDYENDWDKYTIIRGVEETSQMPPESGGAVYLTASKDSLNKDCVIVGYEESRRAYMKYTNAKDEIISLQQVNELLASGKYRAAIGFSASGIDQYFTFYTKVAEYAADAYIKSDSWDKLSKEYVVSSEEELNALSVENGTIAKVARELKQINRANCHTVIKFSDIPANWDKFTRVDKVEHIGGNTSSSCGINLAHYDGHAYVVLRINFVGYMTYVASVYVDSTLTNEVSITKTEVDVKLQEYDFRYIGPTFTMGEPYIDSTFALYEKDVSADAYIKGETWTRLLKDGDVTGGGADITIDSELSDTSENAVQNKVVTAALNEKASIAYVNEKVANISSEEGLEYRKLYAKGDTLGIVTGELTSEQKAYNIETINLYWQNKAIIGYEQVIGEINRISLCKGTDSNGESINFYFDHVLNASVLISITISADGSGTYYSDSGLLIDSVVSDSSTNAIQNKAIKTYVDNAIAEAITNTINTPV